MPSYRVIILEPSGEVLKDSPIVARSVFEAACHATGEQLMRGHRGASYWLRAKVYSHPGKAPSLTRFYSKLPA